ncbi:MAG TPA: ArsA family ATPase [Solirubrobacterales bacterium]|nr:ArsA family ATPase [Solirubrobacterales bacterium]
MIVTGKGGVGKSTVALALGLKAADEGKRTIVCEVSSQERISHAFHRGNVGFAETELLPNLYGISIDPDEAMREYVLLALKVKAMRNMLFRSKLFTYLAAATPGLKELVTIGKIWELALDERKTKGATPYDLVIVDAPATGHGVGVLQTPNTFANVARVGPIASQAETLHRFITNRRKTGVAIVALPEEMPVNETASLERDLARTVGVAVDQVFLNGLYPERFDADDERALTGALAEAAEGPARDAISAALSVRTRAVDQREQLTRLGDITRAPVASLPFLFQPELGADELRELVEALP